MTEHFLSEMAGADLTYRQWPKNVVFDPVRQAVKAFVANLDRTMFLWTMVPVLVETSFLSGMCFAEASYEITGQGPLAGIPEEVRDKVHSTAEMHYSRAPKKPVHHWRKGPEGYAREKQPSTHGVDALTGISSLHPGMEAFADAILLGTWTAFESLSKDLWLAAVNHGDKSLALNVAKISNKTVYRPEGDFTIADQRLSVKIETIKDLGFDLTNRMGDLLLHEKKVSFESLRNTIKAYEVAFGTKVGDQLRADCFKQVGALELIRNLIAHKGGIVDSIFKAEMKKRGFPEFADLHEKRLYTRSFKTRFWNQVVEAADVLIQIADASGGQESVEVGPSP